MPYVNSAISQILQYCTEISSLWRELAKSQAQSRLRKYFVERTSSISAYCGKCDNIAEHCWALQNTHVNKTIAFWFAANAKEYDACVEVRALQSPGTSCYTSLYLRKKKRTAWKHSRFNKTWWHMHLWCVNTFLTLYCLNWFIFCCGVIQCFCLKSFMGLRVTLLRGQLYSSLKACGTKAVEEVNRKLKTLPEILDQTT